MTIIITDRPTAKTIGRTPYERNRRRQIAYGRWNPWTDPASVRDHILALRRHGVGRKRLAQQAGVTEHTLRRIINGKVSKVHITCAEKILAVTDPQPALVDATGSRRRLQALGTLGWDQSTLAARIGWNVRNLNAIVLGKRARITPDTADRIHRLYEQLSAAIAPDGYAASRARASARRHGWVPPLAWDDDTIDDPDAQPAGVGGETNPDGYDDTTVDLACDGRLTYQQLAAHRPDLVETIRRLATRMGDQEIADHLQWPGASTPLHDRDRRTRGQAAVCQIRKREGIPARTRPVAPFPDPRDQGRTRARRKAA